jgi:MoaA/NifB/PqqE/SkfB family radical SAM enzyme
MQYKDIYSGISEEQLDMLKAHLKSRFEFRNSKREFGIVFDILHQCDLKCRGCGTNASFTYEKSLDVVTPTITDIKKAFVKIKDYADEIRVPVFVNIGGGEPFLRKDIIEILKSASEHFGISGVGVDTNGTLENSFDLISEALPHVSYVGISINGLEEYHNWWAGNRNFNAFQRSLGVVEQLCNNAEYVDKIEVTSVASKRNIAEIPDLMDMLQLKGVKNYSLHRAMAIGRMAHYPEIIPDAHDYLKLLLAIIERSKTNRLAVHLHHSIESIHATLLLGLNTYVPDKIGNPDAGSSLGIEPEGHLVFDPWCTTGIWKSLSSGNIFDDAIDLKSAIEGTGNGTVFDLAKTYTAPHLRCEGCEYECSGGSRIAAAANALNNINHSEITDLHILDAMTKIDPACPLYEQKMGG